MKRDDIHVDEHRARAGKPFSQIAVASFALAFFLTLYLCSHASWAEFRWIAPVAAAALIVSLVAIGARLDSGVGSRVAAKVSRPDGWNTLDAAWWREYTAYTRGVLRQVRWWPWCVLAAALFVLVLCATTGLVFNKRHTLAPASAHSAMMAGCGAALVLSFGILVCERVFASRASISGRDAALAGALRVALVTSLGGAACAGFYAWSGVEARWLAYTIALLPASIACELALRAVWTWFTPPGASTTPLRQVDSVIAQVMLRPNASPAEVGASLRRRYGIDLRQSWVVHSTLRMLPIVCTALIALAWLLSGITILQPDQRAVYERFGAPVAVWQPGLHTGMPWPFGVTRVIDNGAVHQIVVSDVAGDNSTAAAAVPLAVAPAVTPAVTPLVPADARTPEQLDRLWDVAHPWETTQVIASGSAQQQNFEVVSADVRLDYRIGPSDADARAALYQATDLRSVVLAIANREVVRYLASHTLEDLVEARQTVIADRIRHAVQQQLAALQSGIEVVAVVIESVHPPAGASAAWHGVQAAQIRAAASIAQARGLAAGLIGNAQQQAQASLAEANAKAAETLATARAQQTSFDADIAAQQAGGPAFALEYYLHNLQTGLQNARLTVIDDRLVGGSRATIDLRSYNTGDAAGVKRLY